MENVRPQYGIVRSFDELQKAFAVRSIVFVEGQSCSYQEEMDGRDLSSVHFLATIDGEPVATARMRHVGDFIKIERLAVRSAWRGLGIGKEMFAFVLDRIAETGCKKIKLHAQTYLVKFYEDFGFVQKGEMFVEANIEHFYMERVG
ncbi:MAG: GNAT family N-acetyltransferase [Rikenellaceae bacterium]|nr:GNAT family N-acetyltransferase [Rikenellaceae bacterium]MCL2692502.1 GNAT family N-acetyltransferase [Rikenellaceae bacterium]